MEYFKIPELTIEDCMVLWCRTVHTAIADLRFRSDFTVWQFRMRVHATIGGLVEMAGDHPKLIHKTFQSFLHRSQSYNDNLAQVQKLLDQAAMGPLFYASVLIDASKETSPPLLSGSPVIRLDSSLRPYVDSRRYSIKIPVEQIPVLSKSCELRYTAQCVVTALKNMCKFTHLDSPQHLDLFLRATRTQLFRYYGNGIDWRQIVSDTAAKCHSQINVVQMHPEILAYIDAGENPNALFTTLNQYNNEMTSDDAGLMFRYVLSYLNFDGWRGHSASFWKAVMLLLCRLPWHASYMTLCVCPYNEKTWQFLEDAFYVTSCCVGTPDLQIQQSAWWAYDATHIVYCWVWSASPKFTDKQYVERVLQLAITKGWEVNDNIYEGGNAMYALFDELSPEMQYKQSEWYWIGFRPPSGIDEMLKSLLVKFRCLLALGVDLQARGKRGTLNQAVERYFAISTFEDYEIATSLTKADILQELQIASVRGTSYA